MRLGPLEIVLIIVVIIAVAVIARIVRTSGGASGQNTASTSPAAANQPGNSRLWGFLNSTGIVMVIAGVAALIAAISLFRWVLQSYLWAFILMAIGFILVLFSRKKR
jgi:hypothetical protein